MLKVNIKEDAGKYIKKMIKAGTDMTPLMNVLGQSGVTLIKLGFKLSASPEGEKWKPLSYRIGKPLLHTGRLRNSITKIATKDSVVIGTNVKYGEPHQLGQGVPKRQFIPSGSLPRNWSENFSNLIIAYMKKQ